MRNSLLYLFVLLYLPCYSQTDWGFSAPQVDLGPFTISDTIYMAIDGSDLNEGSFQHPVASFDKALSLLPFGNPSVNDGHAFGLIMIKEGHYEVTSGFQQHQNQYENEGTYKNVSVEGIGEVTISGTNTQLAEGHLIKLLGSHIYIRNLTLKKGNIHGVLVGGDHQPSDILVEEVTVDSIRSFNLLVSMQVMY